MNSFRLQSPLQVPSVRSALVAFCAATLLIFGASPAWAQNAATGVVSGLVTDQQGAAIPGANVKLTELSTNSSTNVTTNEAGRYTFPSVSPGTYDLAVTKEGFSLTRMPAQKVDVGLALTINVSLQVGQTSTVVEVSASAGAELQVMNATVGSTISGDALQFLPNLGRDASTLATLQVGVTAFGNTAGANQDQNSFQLDGGNNSSDMDGNQRTYTPGNGYTGTSSTGGSPSGVIPTPVESIEEFKVGTSNQTADFAGAGRLVQQAIDAGFRGQFAAEVEESPTVIVSFAVEEAIETLLKPFHQRLEQQRGDNDPQQPTAVTRHRNPAVKQIGQQRHDAKIDADDRCRSQRIGDATAEDDVHIHQPVAHNGITKSQGKEG